jgi:sortase A
MRNKSKSVKFLSLFLAFSGILIIVFFTFPIINYEIVSRRKYPELISPVNENYNPIEKIENIKTDYTKASNWFEANESSDKFGSQTVTHYKISIPSLDVFNATVSLGGEDLSESLVQYPGTAVPGKTGNAVVFGHSVLPQFFDPENYLTIFSTLPRMEKGDLVYVDYDGITYKYIVETMFEVRPTDVQILEQNRDGSYLTLVTCTPPGHPLKPKRLIVRAKVITTNQANADTGN